jgi:hypothetical protein
MDDQRDSKQMARRIAQLEDELDSLREERRKERILQEEKDMEQDKKLRAHTAQATQVAGGVTTIVTLVVQILSKYIG